ncbi:integrase [Paramagnetospirillum caucaseum]|uniref:Integrase n=2 Tax=Paramagnetospirillum caucaseum TaxID=1244869 RepID=M2Z7B7_9PROT|nr:integrase [Paramagnetospirillum caucaseum]
MVKRRPDLTTTQINDLLREWYVSALEHWEEMRGFGSVPFNVEAAKQMAADYVDGVKHDRTFLVEELADELLTQAGIQAAPGSDTYMRVCRGLLRAVADLNRVQAARLEGDYAVAPQDPLFAAQPASQAGSRKKALPKLSEAYARYSRAKAKTWGPDQAKANEDAHELFKEWCGDRRIDRYERTDFTDFVTMLQGLPSKRGKGQAWSGNLSELVAMAEKNPKIKTLAPPTVKRHAGIVSTFFGWCVDEYGLEANFARGAFKWKRTHRRSEERAAWTPEQLRVLFQSPLYHGATSPRFRTKPRPGPHIYRNARYWLPLLGAFHPIRLEEASQLRLEDVQEDEGISFLHVHATEDEDEDTLPKRKVKTAAGWRRIPLHPIPVELGFLDYVAELRSKGEKMVFPDLKPGGTAMRLGYLFSKWFPDYIRSLGITGVSYHSLRHSVITALQRARVHPDLMDQLDGHDTPEERGRYGKGFVIKDWYEAISEIAYDGINANLISPKKQLYVSNCPHD